MKTVAKPSVGKLSVSAKPLQKQRNNYLVSPTTGEKGRVLEPLNSKPEYHRKTAMTNIVTTNNKYLTKIAEMRETENKIGPLGMAGLAGVGGVAGGLGAALYGETHLYKPEGRHLRDELEKEYSRTEMERGEAYNKYMQNEKSEKLRDSYHERELRDMKKRHLANWKSRGRISDNVWNKTKRAGVAGTIAGSGLALTAGYLVNRHYRNMEKQ